MGEQRAFSIIIPTYLEEKNIPLIMKKISEVDFNKRIFEVIIVDDNSPDNTKNMMNELQAQFSYLKFIIRTGSKSLSHAVIEGIDAAKNELLIVMDADLSHPPEKIPEMLILLERDDIDMVIGSRYVAGGCLKNLGKHHKIISYFAIGLSKMVLPIKVKDPLSGFMGIRKTVYDRGKKLNPIGWKIGLEIMIKCGCKNIIEVPIEFSGRQQGRSKLNIKVCFDYLCHIIKLFFYQRLKNVENEG
ncbi:MAG: Glycosyltransferase involved in cell wall biogenesis [uncultured bacterium]|nr:MAG: Glycosyltransferase involved in cell wall biogenesis [uncultured bacterium]OGT16331.1 MAG: hypothetical protein A3B69_01415 [Gammaproteobacteria bacterium RIFCSPHIGHO2_02_FULL_38_33]OGT24103.1 MAG: hypothetical protein A2W47_01270 [Gammaproteobacteria bacterium RIFCSPHIGHO2_12_38_15]OGT67183.1 MAG: hypothetical protein A3I12_07705 [Gammaproteobacteria bacterium RIFCSPLOWO2_02_FULL_38_11]OGT77913.1 MAG: hypothetical protein A3G71_04730 [Gammaproteobacteria bacterium RIFCSPLOWO2_12_FULL_3